MSRLVLVVPLKEGAQEKARSLLVEGPPFELEQTEFDRHEVFLTEREVIFLFEAPGPSATLRLLGEDSSLWRAASTWQQLTAERPRKAQTAYSWTRPDHVDEIFFDPTPWPGDSEGGDEFAPSTEG